MKIQCCHGRMCQSIPDWNIDLNLFMNNKSIFEQPGVSNLIYSCQNPISFLLDTGNIRSLLHEQLTSPNLCKFN